MVLKSALCWSVVFVSVHHLQKYALYLIKKMNKNNNTIFFIIEMKEWNIRERQRKCKRERGRERVREGQTVRHKWNAYQDWRVSWKWLCPKCVSLLGDNIPLILLLILLILIDGSFIYIYSFLVLGTYVSREEPSNIIMSVWHQVYVN